MSVLVLGASHRSASSGLLEQLALGPGDAAKMRAAALDVPDVREVVILGTCNRVEVYVVVNRFHGAVDGLTRLLADRAPATPDDELLASLFVHYDAGVVAHLFSVAAGLDSMVVGEAQILGQVRDALRSAQADQTVGTSLNAVFQQALRVGKRAHAETGIDAAGRSVVSVALARAERSTRPLHEARALVIGAGSVAALTVATLTRAGIRDVVVCSRTLDNAVRLAAPAGGRAAEWGDLADEVSRAGVVFSCTGATGTVISRDTMATALDARRSTWPLVVIDLALPHDVDPEAADLPGVILIGLAELATDGGDDSVAADLRAVQAIVTAEVEAYLAERRRDEVAPTVVALRSMATAVVEAELDRLWRRLPELTDRQRQHVEQAVRRTADKVLHEPTVRVQEFAERIPASSYAAALAELFALDPVVVGAVTAPLEAP